MGYFHDCITKKASVAAAFLLLYNHYSRDISIEQSNGQSALPSALGDIYALCQKKKPYGLDSSRTEVENPLVP